MKRVWVWLGFALLPRGALAQPSPPAEGVVRVSTRRSVPANTVTLDVGPALQGALTLAVEHAFTPSVSAYVGSRMQVGTGLAPLGDTDRFLDEEVGFGLGATVGVRVYGVGYAPSGFFVGFEHSTLAQSWRWSATSPASIDAHHVLGLMFGYQAVFGRVAVFRVSIGDAIVWRGENYLGQTLTLGLAGGVPF